MDTETAHVSLFARQSRSVFQRLVAGGYKQGVSLYWVCMLTVGSAIIHLVGAPGQWSRSHLLTLLLLGCALIQFIIALAIVIVPARRLLIVATIVDGVLVLLWLLAHTIGLPIFLTWWQLEPLNIFDLFLPVMEALAALLLLRLLRRQPRTRSRRTWQTLLFMLLGLLLAGNLMWFGSLSAANDAWLSLSSPVYAPAGQTTTLAYCNAGREPLAMDVTEPSGQALQPAPVVLYIHGGVGIYGDRQITDWEALIRAELVQHGFVVASIDYGLFPFYSGREQVEEAKCAVRFLRTHARALGIDPQRIGVYGDSHGGYFSAMLGTVGRSAGFDVGQYLNQSSRVQAVVDMFGFTELNMPGSPGWVQFIVGKEFGSSPADQRANSPLTYVAPGDPPFLILHGTADALIRPEQSQVLAQRLRASGVPVTLILVQHGQHGLDTPGEQPGPITLASLVSRFFIRILTP